MAAFSDYLEAKLLNHCFRNATFTKPTELAICLMTTLAVDGDSGEFSTGTGVECSGTGYARVQLDAGDNNYDDPDGTGITGNTDEIVFPVAESNWGTIVGVAIVDSATLDEGNLLYHGALSQSKAINTGDTFRFSPSSLQIALT